MLNAAELAHARAIIRDTLQPGTIQRVVDTGGVQTWPTTENILCRSGMPRQGGPTALTARIGNDPGAMLYLPVNVAVREGDRITDPQGTTFSVAFVPPLRTDELVRSVVGVELRDPGGRP